MDELRLILLVVLLLIAFLIVPYAVEADDISMPDPELWDLKAVKRCLKFLNVTRTVMVSEGWMIDPAFVFGIMAQESLGFVNPNEALGWPLDRVGSRGLMQVAPFPWRVDNPDKLLDPRLNIWWGVHTLVYANEISWGNMEMALAIYNCGQEGEARGCGYDYAKRVIHHWAPLFREAFVDGRWRNKLYWSREDEALIQQWLESYGYKEKNENGNSSGRYNLAYRYHNADHSIPEDCLVWDLKEAKAHGGSYADRCVHLRAGLWLFRCFH